MDSEMGYPIGVVIWSLKITKVNVFRFISLQTEVKNISKEKLYALNSFQLMFGVIGNVFGINTLELMLYVSVYLVSSLTWLLILKTPKQTHELGISMSTQRFQLTWITPAWSIEKDILYNSSILINVST